MDSVLAMFVASLAIGLIVAAVLLIIRDLYVGTRAAVDRRLGRDETEEIPLQRLPMREDEEAPRGPIGRIDRWFDRLMIETGMEFSPETAFLMAIAAGVALGGVLFLWRDDLLAGIIGAVLGIAAVMIFFIWRRGRRRKMIQEQLPDVMELLARAVRAGESIDQAIEMAGETVAQPLGTEFRRCSRQLEMGLSMDSAMRALTYRAPLPEVRILAAALTVQRHAGGNLPITLERLVRVIRDRISYRRQFRATTAAGRISTVVIALVGPLMFAYLFIWQRDYLKEFLELPQGQMLLGLAIVLQIVGLIWIYRILSTDY